MSTETIAALAFTFGLTSLVAHLAVFFVLTKFFKAGERITNILVPLADDYDKRVKLPGEVRTGADLPPQGQSGDALYRGDR